MVTNVIVHCPDSDSRENPGPRAMYGAILEQHSAVLEWKIHGEKGNVLFDLTVIYNEKFSLIYMRHSGPGR